MTTLNKTQLINSIAEASSTDKETAVSVLNALTELIKSELSESNPITIPGLVKFRVVAKPATPERMGKNPSTGAPMKLKAKEASKKLKVTPVKELKELVK